MYLLDQNILAYLLDQNILAHPISIKFYVPSQQKYPRKTSKRRLRSSKDDMQPSANDLGIRFEWQLRSSNDNTQPSAYDLGKLFKWRLRSSNDDMQPSLDGRGTL